MSRIFRDLYFDRTPRAVPEPAREPPDPEIEPKDLVDVIEEPPAPAWFQIWSAEVEQADSIVLAAQAQAVDVRRRAQAEGEAEGYASGYQEGLQRGREDGYASGHAEGYEDGHALALAEAATTLHTSTQIASAAELDRAQLIEAVEPELVNLVIAITRRIVQAELTTDPTLVRRCVQAALRTVGDSPTAVLHLNPEDVEILQEVWEELRQRFGDGGLQLVSDARIQRGGCIVDTEIRTVDAQIESRLEEIQRQFLRIAETHA